MDIKDHKRKLRQERSARDAGADQAARDLRSGVNPGDVLGASRFERSNVPTCPQQYAEESGWWHRGYLQIMEREADSRRHAEWVAANPPVKKVRHDRAPTEIRRDHKLYPCTCGEKYLDASELTRHLMAN